MHWLLPWASVVVAISSTTVWADEKHDCLEGVNHDLRIQACSALIEGNANDAIAYYSRAVAYQLKGDVDRAISDYTKAIELNPYHAAAYDGRGRAYASKGSYINAVTDVTKASELAGTSSHQLAKVITEVGRAKASELAPTSAPPPKDIATGAALKKTGLAKEVKKVATTSPVTKKASAQPPDGSKPAWAPQAWGSYGQSAN
jgi:tetratricopeptide (TPR) repeat protein